MSIPTVSWDETSPAGTQAISLGDDRIRELKTQLREVIEVDHNFSSSGQDADYGKHNQLSLLEQADLGTGAEGKPILGAQTTDSKAELVFTDEDDNDVQITSAGAIYLAAGRITNNTYIKAIDNAGTGTVDLIKANASDEIELGAVTTLPDTSKLATSGAPTEDEQIANKKYVDDQLAAVGTPPTGSITMWGGALASPPAGWLTCDGSAISRTTYAALFAVISTIYGVGNGSTTFNLPDFSNKFPYGADEGTDSGNASVGSSGGQDNLSGNDDSVTNVYPNGNVCVVGGNTCANEVDTMPPYLAVGFIIKT